METKYPEIIKACDGCGVIYNNKNLEILADILITEKSILFPWTPDETTQCDILMTLAPCTLHLIGGDLFGNRRNEKKLYVSIIRFGTPWGFHVEWKEDLFPSYIVEKMQLPISAHSYEAKKLNQLIRIMVHFVHKKI